MQLESKLSIDDGPHAVKRGGWMCISPLESSHLVD